MNLWINNEINGQMNKNTNFMTIDMYQNIIKIIADTNKNNYIRYQQSKIE